jgi:hypothetical protein
VEFDPINETGDDNFALSDDGGNGESLRGVLGLGVEQSGRTPMGFATTRLRFGWMHEYLDPQETFVSTLASDSITSQITDRGIDPGRDWGFVRVQVDAGRFLGGQTSFGYQGQANSNTSFNALIGGIQWVR